MAIFYDEQQRWLYRYFVEQYRRVRCGFDYGDDVVQAFGAAVREWTWLRTYRVRRALPVRWPLERRAPQALRPGVWVAGDWTNSASIQGAMESGERVAEMILGATGR